MDETESGSRVRFVVSDPRILVLVNTLVNIKNLAGYVLSENISDSSQILVSITLFDPLKKLTN